jgi:hypothetical protein
MRSILAVMVFACAAGAALAQPTTSTTGSSTTNTTTTINKNDEFNTYEMKRKTASSSSSSTSSNSASGGRVTVSGPRSTSPPPPRPPSNIDVNLGTFGNGAGVDAPDSVMVLYDQAGFRGKRLTLIRDWPNLAPRRFDNLASSARVEGEWELCEGPDYTGRCVRVSAATGDLSGLGMSDLVSSARRVR